MIRANLRFALRGLAKSPGFTVVAILTLALGKDSNTAVFTIANGVLENPLPFPAPQRLMGINNSGAADLNLARGPC